eukprot:6418111-Prymnesium_polylepis.1
MRPQFESQREVQWRIATYGGSPLMDDNAACSSTKPLITPQPGFTLASRVALSNAWNGVQPAIFWPSVGTARQRLPPSLSWMSWRSDFCRMKGCGQSAGQTKVASGSARAVESAFGSPVARVR